ncbi:short chain dehydrogenase reductase [Immersiella caudata]|uniref:Short chain dehydrogenase reductase n=1 Tax=Immersiella caudata TaxID=314043 RepID=A0AA39WT66_9PEZI|nr:short chain dehydrogenase reductase [Immersiella caudata]
MASPGFFRPSMLRQNFPGAAPTFTEKNISDLSGKVYLITGSNTGIGKELAQILYSANATVYMACRTESKARNAMQDIRSAAPSSKGRLEFLPLDLSDLRTVKAAAEQFIASQTKLHVLFNNAGVMVPPDGQKTAQGYDLQLGTNCLGPFLLTQLLTPTLARTAEEVPVGTVRVVWVASMAAELYSVKDGVDMSNLAAKGYIREPGAMEKYGISKAGNYFHSVEYARRHKKDGIVSVAINPGNLDSDLYRSVDDQSGFQRLGLRAFTKLMLHPVINGAYTELFAGLSDEVTPDKTGAWIGPWGRFFTIRKDVDIAGKPKSEGGTGVAEKFWVWSMEQVEQYL